MNRFDECINLSNEVEPCFLCSWNDNQIVEIHTKNTLVEKYKDSNLFEGELPLYDCFHKEELAIDLLEWIDTINLNENWREQVLVCDNFQIQRIK
jgi:hypothetical protein